MTRLIPDREIDDKDSQFSNMLWSVRLKATPGRISLLRMLSSEKHPLSVLEIRKKITNLNRSSLFRVLESLVKTDLIHRINFGSTDSLYEMTYGRKHHHHIICTECREIEDVTDIGGANKCFAHITTEQVALNSNKFSAVHSHSLEFFGLCKKCS